MCDVEPIKVIDHAGGESPLAVFAVGLGAPGVAPLGVGVAPSDCVAGTVPAAPDRALDDVAPVPGEATVVCVDDVSELVAEGLELGLEVSLLPDALGSACALSSTTPASIVPVSLVPTAAVTVSVGAVEALASAGAGVSADNQPRLEPVARLGCGGSVGGAGSVVVSAAVVEAASASVACGSSGSCGGSPMLSSTTTAFAKGSCVD